MYARVAFCAQRDQILFLIPTGLAPEVLVVQLEMYHGAAHLAAPVVALQHLSMQFTVLFWIQPEARFLAADPFHEAFAATSDKKASCWVFGRNRK